MTMPNEAVELRRMTRLGALLAATDFAQRRIAFPAARIERARHARRVTRWRVAAAAVLLLGAAMLHQPLRAWVVARAQDAWHAVTGAPRAAAAPERRPVAAAGPSSVSFAPAAGAFTIRVARRQAAGVLAITFVADSLVTAAPVGTGALGEWLVRPDGVELINARGATASLAVRVPLTVERLLVVVGGAAPVAVTRDTTISLTGARP